VASQTLGDAFATKRNGLNVIRLLLAVTVIVFHAFPLGGFGDEPRIGNMPFASLSVLFFFAISGFLITASRERTKGARYLWHRVIRIFPGYAVCLIVIAAVIAPLAWLFYNATLDGYPIAEAAKYVLVNLGLYTHTVPSIPGTQVTVDPEFQYWDGAAWSLFYEFLCYLVVAALAMVSLLRVWSVAAVLIVGSALLVVWEFDPDFFLLNSPFVFRLVTTGTLFAAGSLLWLLRDKIAYSHRLGAVALVVSVGGLAFLQHAHWLVALPVAYLVIWASLALPISGWIKKTDISYGVYIYGYPIATLLTIYGVNRLGPALYILITLAIVIPIAFASWFGVERRALKLKDAALWPRGRNSRARPAEVPSSTAA
jgi:peptidoglycan/LPS O-acetylase OafA/YrhL